MIFRYFILEGENSYRCDHCETLVEAVLTRSVTEAPENLLLTLLRFQYDRTKKRRTKIMDPVCYPLNLRLPLVDVTVGYFLYAVIVHSGLTLDGGHYYTVATTPTTPRSSDVDKSKITDKDINQAKSWFVFNDSQVSRINVDSLNELSKKKSYDTPYVLLYRKYEDASSSPSKSTPEEPLLLPAYLKQLVDEGNIRHVFFLSYGKFAISFFI